MGAGVVSIGRRNYAVGLYWENSPIGRVVQAARDAARQPGQQADFYAIRAGVKDERVPQFGLGQTSAGHKANMPAFAGCLANQQHGSWAGAFRLKEGVVVTVVRDDLIVPDGDQFFPNEVEARERLLQEIGFGGLQRCYAPEAWSIPGADSMPISLLLDERRDVRLRAVSLPRKKILIGAAVIGLVAVGLGVAWYIQEQEAERAAQLAQQQAALERARAEANRIMPGMLQNQEPQYPPPDRKWEKAPTPLSIVQSCQDGLAKIPAASAGWRMSSLKCDGNGITLTWTRDKGPSLPPMTSLVTADGNTANLTVPLTTLPVRGPETLIDPNEITRRYLGQAWPATLQRLPEDPLPPPPPDYKGTWNPPLPPWIKRSFTLTASQLPGDMPTYFNDIPGIVITGLSFTPGNTIAGTWTVQGVIYENRT